MEEANIKSFMMIDKDISSPSKQNVRMGPKRVGRFVLRSMKDACKDCPES